MFGINSLTPKNIGREVCHVVFFCIFGPGFDASVESGYHSEVTILFGESSWETGNPLRVSFCLVGEKGTGFSFKQLYFVW